jgi:uridine kinase
MTKGNPVNTTIQQTLADLLRHKSPADPVRNGIAGGSGSGKTTVAERIKAGLGSCSVEMIGLDRFFKPEAELPRYWSAYHQQERPDFNRPDSLRVNDMLASCASLSGFNVILFDGHFALYYPQMRELMDIKCFVEIDLAEMLERRTQRNLSVGYGGSAEEIWHYNRECVAPQYLRHLRPTRAYADIVIPNNRTSAAEQEAIILSICEAVLATAGCQPA